MIVKVIGIILALVGLLMLKFFPDLSDYQSAGFSKAGILIGVVLIAIGAIMLIAG
jgi:hypothetical protein